ncbi:MAG: site-2 protease family protein [Bacilli bacterium]|nr:site-2 protease family protein [Bacilli bacterium]
MEILNILGGLAVFIIILGVIIAVHEGGHFYFARRAGILAREFAFGMGPILWKKKKGETLYSVRAFPIGGFCAIAGEEVEDDPFKSQPRVKLDVRDGVIHNFYMNVDDESINFPAYDIMEYDIYDQDNTGNLYMEVIKDGERFHFKVKSDAVVYMPKFEYQIAPYNRTLGSKSKRARAMVMFGGPLMNFLLALVVFFIAGAIQGRPATYAAEIRVSENTYSYQAGLRDGDVITKLQAGELPIMQIDEWEDISHFMRSYRDNGSNTDIFVTYKRDGKTYTTTVKPTITINSLAIESEFVAGVGLKVIGYIDANDGLINNTALKNYYFENPAEETGKKELIITSFEYDGREVAATNLVLVYHLFNSYKGDRELEEANLITVNFLSDDVEGSAKVKPYGKAIMDYQTKQNGLEIVKVAMWVSPKHEFNLGYSFKYSLNNTVNSGTAVFSTLGMLFRGDISLRELSGFVGIADATVKITGAGLVAILNWTGLLSVNIGLLNLLPIPALDGGRLVFLGYEAITKKKPNQKVETWLITATMLLLFALMIYVTINDFIKVI